MFTTTFVLNSSKHCSLHKIFWQLTRLCVKILNLHTLFWNIHIRKYTFGKYILEKCTFGKIHLWKNTPLENTFWENTHQMILEIGILCPLSQLCCLLSPPPPPPLPPPPPPALSGWPWCQWTPCPVSTGSTSFWAILQWPTILPGEQRKKGMPWPYSLRLKCVTSPMRNELFPAQNGSMHFQQTPQMSKEPFSGSVAWGCGSLFSYYFSLLWQGVSLY